MVSLSVQYTNDTNPAVFNAIIDGMMMVLVTPQARTKPLCFFSDILVIRKQLKTTLQRIMITIRLSLTNLTIRVEEDIE